MKLLLFTQPLCSPCRQIKPHAEAVSVHYGLELEQIDITENPEYIDSHEVTSTPTFYLVHDDDSLTRLRSRTTLSLISELSVHLGDNNEGISTA